MANPRVPKLDPVWMAALGYVLLDVRGPIQWNHEEYKFWLRDETSPADVVKITIRRASEAALREHHIALRNVLLPALGLEEKSEYDAGGYTKRTFIAPED